ncbi:multidrug effflux MFS transporter [Rhizobium halophytocola]|uniref:Bcr/CflA family efflux transporter n=1 Tax=Rhizobium halophytocola TaxID=735519 RepID=A0ABS4DWF0_9HYPH|nr:multidrug effflux MFS transporter [Rhizobium halophytocola]MBP1850003.1 DHA1 family bicyclomycin/chloramphenicol resistance-like MFS transporter [Rhizobium halophytocola]
MADTDFAAVPDMVCDRSGRAGPQDGLPAARPKVAIWLLALITLSGTLAMHIFVPAMPAAAEGLGVGIGRMQMAVSLYILGLAVGQLFYGPISDRYGRRPVLMAGLVIYTVAGAVALFAPGITSLLAARLFQALGGCAGLVLGRAIVRDITAAEDTARKMALMNLMTVIGPGLAPIIGGALTVTLGWRSIFVVLTAMGCGLLLLAWRKVPETASPGQGASAREVGRNYRALVSSPVFLGFAIGGGCATTSMYAFVTAAPFIFTQDLGRPASETGFYIATLVFGVWIGSMIVSRLIGRLAMRTILIGANLISVAAAAALFATVVTGTMTVAGTVALIFIFTLGCGGASPMALTQAVSVNPKVTGSASGLYGCAQMLVGALCSALSGVGTDPAFSAALILLCAGLVAQISFWVALRLSR